MSELVEVRIIGHPLDIQRVAQEHIDELQREFALIVQSTSTGELTIPVRLLELIESLTQQYGELSSAQEDARDAAMARGDASIDQVFRLPREAAEASRQLGELLDLADEYCREGGTLLTLATPPDALRMRRWYLGEFIRQIEDGAEPIPWSEYKD